MNSESIKRKDIHDYNRDSIRKVDLDSLEMKFPNEIIKVPVWKKIIVIIFKIIMMMVTLYGFLVGLSLLSDALKVLTAKSASNLFSFVRNPLAGLMVGIIVTSLLQSSSTTTSLVVGLVGSGILSVGYAVPIVMGANIGTSVTNTIVAIGQIGSGNQFRRSFAGATVHDCFNILTVFIFLPIEWIFSSVNHECGFLCWMCSGITTKILGLKGASFSSPLDKIIKPFTLLFVEVNKEVYQAYSYGCNSDSLFCSVNGTSVLDGCFNGNGMCTYKADWHSLYDGASIIKKSWLSDSWNFNDTGAGIFLLILSLVLLIASLLSFIKLIQMLIMGQVENYLQKALNMNGYLAILIGAAITALLQSSSVVTSALTPLVGIGILELEGMYPLTIGANIGTTVTAILASLATNSPDSITTSLCHLFFNFFGVLLFYPIPYMRNIPLSCARWLGETVFKYRWFGFVYMVMVFFVIPGYVLLIVELCSSDNAGTFAGGIVLVLLTVIAVVSFLIWYHKYNGVAVINSLLLKGSSKDYLNYLERKNLEKDFPTDSMIVNLARII